MMASSDGRRFRGFARHETRAAAIDPPKDELAVFAMEGPPASERPCGILRA